MMPQFVLVSWLWGLHCWEATQKENPEKSLSCALEIKTSEGTPDHRDKWRQAYWEIYDPLVHSFLPPSHLSNPFCGLARINVYWWNDESIVISVLHVFSSRFIVYKLGSKNCHIFSGRFLIFKLENYTSIARSEQFLWDHFLSCTINNK